MKYLLITSFLFLGFVSKGQELLSDKTNIECELFVTKKEFDISKRLEEIKSLGGQLVTVYLVKGKHNKIKTSYMGRVSLKLIENGESSLKNLTSVLVIEEDKGNGQISIHFPLTDSKSYRIYLTKCLKE